VIPRTMIVVSVRAGRVRRLEGPLATLTKARKILVVDDHPIVRAGVCGLLAREVDLVTCGEAENIEDALAQFRTVRPDAIIVDISLGRESGLDLIRLVRSESRDVPILALSMHDEMTYAERTLRHGANGYVMKSEVVERLVEALRRVLSGKAYVSARVAERMLTTLSSSSRTQAYSVDRLTDRELEIFRLLGMGVRSAEIAERFGVSRKTIETHRVRIKAKLGVETASELVILAAGWVRDGELSG
jgi:DNA-binding NarL/FixJ family response regulator